MDEQYDVIVLGTGLKVSVSVCMGWTAMLLTHGSECLPFMIACTQRTNHDQALLVRQLR